MNTHVKIAPAEENAPFKPRATYSKPVVCFAVRLAALLRVRPFISTEPTRFYLNGVFVHAHDQGGAVCVATDGHRLGVRHDAGGIVHEPRIVRLPKELKAPPKHMRDPWAIMVRLGESFATLSIVEAIHDRDYDTAENAIARLEECVTRFGDVLIDGTFPDYIRTIPLEQKDDHLAAFNGKYIGSFGEYLTIRGGTDPRAPAIIIDHSDPDFLGVVMPIRLQDAAKPRWASGLSYPSAPQSSDAVEQPASRSPSPEKTPGVEAAGGEGEV